MQGTQATGQCPHGQGCRFPTQPPPLPSSWWTVAPELPPVPTAGLSSASLAQDQSPVTPVSTLCAEARETARRLLTHYVKVQGLVISQMLRKSVETRDWLSSLEPRNVRAVMKRVVEDTTAIDVQVLPRAGQGSPNVGWGCWENSPLRMETGAARLCLHLWPPSSSAPPFHPGGS